MRKIKRAASSHSAGFTLIEMLVVLVIIIIINGIIIFNIGLQRQNLALFHSAQELSLDLRRAQSFALLSKIYNKNPDSSICTPSDVITCVPCGWGLHFNGIGSNNYVIFADLALAVDCSNRDFIRSPNGSEDFETINLEPGIIVNIISSGLTDVVFTSPEPTVKFTPDQNEASITLINKNYDTSAVIFNKNGFISSP